MLLKDLKWEEDNGYWLNAYVPLPDGTWFAAHKTVPTEKLYYAFFHCNEPPDHRSTLNFKILKHWAPADHVEAQCVLFEIFGRGDDEAR